MNFIVRLYERFFCNNWYETDHDLEPQHCIDCGIKVVHVPKEWVNLCLSCRKSWVTKISKEAKE